MSIHIAVVNQSTVVSDPDVQDLIVALQMQLNTDFVPIYGVGASLSFLPKDQPVPSGVWELVILDNSDQAGALGYHELTSNGDPLGKIFAGDDIQFGTSWTVTASHELLEMMGDPDINLVAENPGSSGPIFYAYEVCDACEDDQFGYDITLPDSGKIIKVSDFVFPNWFSVIESGKGLYDLKGHITQPLQILTNGYIGVFDTSNQDGWTQITGKFESEERAHRAVPKLGHRRDRRAMHRHDWKNSER